MRGGLPLSAHGLSAHRADAIRIKNARLRGTGRSRFSDAHVPAYVLAFAKDIEE